MQQLTQRQIAWRVAQDLPEGAHVTLGSGMPAMVADHVRANVHVHRADATNMQAPDYIVVEAGDAMRAGAGAQHLFVMTEYFAKDGTAAIVPLSRVPGRKHATTVYTDIAVLELSDGKVWIRELIEGITLHTLQAETDVELHVSPRLTLLSPPSLM